VCGLAVVFFFKVKAMGAKTEDCFAHFVTAKCVVVTVKHASHHFLQCMVVQSCVCGQGHGGKTEDCFAPFRDSEITANTMFVCVTNKLNNTACVVAVHVAT
jgi:hypothetical protein